MPTVQQMTNEHGYVEAYAWPGGYDVAYYTEDEGLLCAFCVNDAKRDGYGDDPQWKPVQCDVTDSWNNPEPCENCSRMIGPEED